MTMNKNELIQSLRAEQERIRQEAEQRMASIGEAIAVIENTSSAPLARTVEQPGLSVSAMLLKAAKALGDVTLDHVKNGNWNTKVMEMFPDKVEMIKRGIYTAVAQLLNRNQLTRVQGGFRLVQSVDTAPAAI